MYIDHTAFFNGYRAAFGRLKQGQVTGIELLGRNMEADPAISDLRWAAYMLATVKHDCAETWQPVEEVGKGVTRPYGREVIVRNENGNDFRNKYYGRGYVQLTWMDNYGAVGRALGLGDRLMLHPDLALAKDVAYGIMSYGMRHGTFTGRKLATYINDAKVDYEGARRVVNGTDQAARIARYAGRCETMLLGSIPAMAATAPAAT